ncbi:MAG: hypothetical protein GF390_02260 [Candidatus Pacebacteria bacterium]|nr:hypothetical protein [Candidatus Paceibacterota bacterium]
MKKLIFLTREQWLVVLFLLISLGLRIYKITAIPPVISHDEVYYMAEAKALAVSGHDPTGTWRPWWLTAANPLFAELPGTLMMPAAWLFPNNTVLAAKATAIVLGTILPLVLAGVAGELTKNKLVTGLTLVLASFNPWIFQFSRMGFDALYSLSFYFLAIYLMLKLKSWQRLWAIIPLILGFYQYQGLKVIFVPMVLATLFYLWWQSKPQQRTWQKQLPLLIMGSFTVVFFTVHLLRMGYQEAGGRVNDLVFFQDQYLAKQVDLQRQQAIESPVQKFFTNKLTVLIAELANKYLQAFEPTQLFVHGEARRNPFSVYSRGVFHLVTVVLIIIGLINLWQHRSWRKQAWFLSLLVLLAPIPAAINASDSWIMFRASFLFPLLIILAGIGASKIWQIKKPWSAIILTVIYLLLVSDFFYEYFYRYPIYGTKEQYFAERLLSSYLKRGTADQQFLVLADEDYFVFTEIVVHNNLINQQNLDQLQQAYQDKNYQANNFTVATRCLDVNSLANKVTVIADPSVQLCDGRSKDQLPPELRVTEIKSLLDNGTIFAIYQDSVCDDYPLDSRVQVQQDVFAVEQLTDQQFCENFLTRE